MIDAATAGDLAANSSELFAKAYASNDAKPVWTAVTNLERAGRAREALRTAAPALTEGSDQAQAVERSITLTDKLIDRCRDHIAGTAKHDYINRDGSRQATRAQMIAAAFASPEGRALNRALEQTGTVDRHRQLVASATKPAKNRPVVAVTDSRWLDQTMNYQAIITQPTEHTVAVNSSDFGIILSPQCARAAISTSEGYDETLTHELVHTAQSVPKGRPLADQGSLGRLRDRHRMFEAQMLEGSTQALANHLRAEAGDPSYTGSDEGYYPTWTAVVDSIASRVPASERGTFYTEMSETPTHQRTRYLAKTVFGLSSVDEVSEQQQRHLVDSILPLTERADMEFDDPNCLNRLRGSIDSLLGQRTAVAA